MQHVTVGRIRETTSAAGLLLLTICAVEIAGDASAQTARPAGETEQECLARYAAAIPQLNDVDALHALICGDADIRAATAAMNRAYAAIVEAAPDDELRSMLIESQRRWIAVLDRRLAGISDDPDAPEGNDTQREALLGAIRARMSQLATQQDDGTPDLVHAALSQREFSAQFSGGPFAGHMTSCDMVTIDNIYACFATSHYQNGNRICSIDVYWATGTVYVKHYVTDVVDGEPRLVASCSFNGDDTACPGSFSESTGWNSRPDPNNWLYARESLPQLDAEAWDIDDQNWLSTCLTDASFPFTE